MENEVKYCASEDKVVADVTETQETNDTAPSAGTSYTVSDITEILKDIDTMNASFEANRQMFEAKDKLLKACAVVGIGRIDHELIHKKLIELNMTDDELDKIMHNEKKLTEMFFTKENGKPMKLKQVAGYSDFEVKREMIAYIHSFYVAEKEMNEQIDLVHGDVAEATNAATEVMIGQVAASFLNGIETARQKLPDIADEKKRKEKEAKLNSIYMAFTFDDVIQIARDNPRFVTNTIYDFNHETCVKRIGERYGKKRMETNTGSALYSIIADKPENSIEAKFLRPDQYVSGYENLFSFILVKYYGQTRWEKESYVKERHNSACTLLRALVEGKLPKDDRDKYVENIVKVWKVFYDELTKNK